MQKKGWEQDVGHHRQTGPYTSGAQKLFSLRGKTVNAEYLMVLLRADELCPLGIAVHHQQIGGYYSALLHFLDAGRSELEKWKPNLVPRQTAKYYKALIAGKALQPAASASSRSHMIEDVGQSHLELEDEPGFARSVRQPLQEAGMPQVLRKRRRPAGQQPIASHAENVRTSGLEQVEDPTAFAEGVAVAADISHPACVSSPEMQLPSDHDSPAEEDMQPPTSSQSAAPNSTCAGLRELQVPFDPQTMPHEEASATDVVGEAPAAPISSSANSAASARRSLAAIEQSGDRGIGVGDDKKERRKTAKPSIGAKKRRVRESLPASPPEVSKPERAEPMAVSGATRVVAGTLSTVFDLSTVWMDNIPIVKRSSAASSAATLFHHLTRFNVDFAENDSTLIFFSSGCPLRPGWRWWILCDLSMS